MRSRAESIQPEENSPRAFFTRHGIRQLVTWRRILSALLLLCPLFIKLQAAAEEEAPSASEEETKAATKAPAKPTASYTAGVFFGHILYVDPEGRYIFAKPVDPHLRRQYFYLDKKTRYTYSIEGERKEKAFDDLIEGQKVAVRFVAESSLMLADEVFVVFEEFLQPQAYSKRRTESFGPGISVEQLKEKMGQKGQASKGDGEEASEEE